MIDKFKRCRACGVPIVAIATADEYATAAAVASAANGSPCVAWDAARGARPANDAGAGAMPVDAPDPFGGPPDPGAYLAGPAGQLPDGTILIMLGAGRFVGGPRPAAAILALRDSYKSTGRTIVLLGPSVSLPPELSPHVEALTVDLPTDAERSAILMQLHADAGAPEPSADILARAVAGTRGLPGFAVEQAGALAMRPNGLDLPTLRARWKHAIDSTAGLTVDDTPSTLDDLAGLENVKTFARSLARSKRPPTAIVLLDEFGKSMAGGGGAGGAGDNTGVAQDQEATILTEMQDTRADGLIAFGVPGSGKSAFARALAAALGAVLIRMDLGAMKSSHLGDSEHAIRGAMGTIRSLAGGRAFYVATANELSTIKAEIRRRFRSGVWFFDTPTADERAAIVALYSAKHHVSAELADWPDLTGWTGAEIETCAERADAWGIGPKEASAYVVPVARMAAETVDTMRRAAAGRYLSASYPGPYRYAGPESTSSSAPTGRRFTGKE